MNSGQKKGINFDLDTNSLKIHYTKRTGVMHTMMSGTIKIPAEINPAGKKIFFKLST